MNAGVPGTALCLAERPCIMHTAVHYTKRLYIWPADITNKQASVASKWMTNNSKMLQLFGKHNKLKEATMIHAPLHKCNFHKSACSSSSPVVIYIHILVQTRKPDCNLQNWVAPSLESACFTTMLCGDQHVRFQEVYTHYAASSVRVCYRTI